MTPRWTNLSVLDALNRLSDVIAQDVDPLELMSASVKMFRDIFEADRVWLVYPCDPAVPTCKVCYEDTSAEFPGLFSMDGRLTVSPGVAELFKDALAADGPIVQIRGTEKAYDRKIPDRIAHLSCFKNEK